MSSNNTVQVFWVALGNVSSLALSILSAAILSRYFSKADYGTYKQILYIYSTLLVVFTAGLPTVFSYYLPRYNLNQGKSIVWKVSKVLFISGLFFSIFLFTFSNKIAGVLNNPDLSNALKAFSPVPMLLLPTLGIEGIFATYKKTYYIAFYEVITRMFTLLFIVGPVIWLHGTYIHAIYGWNIAAFASFFIAILFKGIPFKGIKSEVTTLKLKEIFNYSLPLLTGSLFGMAIKAADQFYISRYFGSTIFAEFSNGFIEIPLVTMVTSSMAIVFLPVFSKLFFENSGTDAFITLWNNMLKKSALIIYPIVVFFIFNAKEIVTILYSNKYNNSVLYFQIAMLMNFFNIILFAPFLLAMGKTKFYSNLHMIIALGEWILGFVLVIAFNSPIVIAILSVSLGIVKVMIAFLYMSRLFKLRIAVLIPLKEIVSYLLHSILIIIVIRLIISQIGIPIFPIIKLMLTATLYTLLLLLSAIPLKLDYWSILGPIKERLLTIFR